MSAAKSYAKPVEIGEVMTGGVVGQVAKSNHPAFKPGDIVEGSLGWQDYAVADPALLRKIDPRLAPIQTAVGTPVFVALWLATWMLRIVWSVVRFPFRVLARMGRAIRRRWIYGRMGALSDRPYAT